MAKGGETVLLNCFSIMKKIEGRLTMTKSLCLNSASFSAGHGFLRFSCETSSLGFIKGRRGLKIERELAALQQCRFYVQHKTCRDGGPA